MVVLDALHYIQGHLAPDLRWVELQGREVRVVPAEVNGRRG